MSTLRCTTARSQTTTAARHRPTWAIPGVHRCTSPSPPRMRACSRRRAGGAWTDEACVQPWPQLSHACGGSLLDRVAATSPQDVARQCQATIVALGVHRGWRASRAAEKIASVHITAERLHLYTSRTHRGGRDCTCTYHGGRDCTCTHHPARTQTWAAEEIADTPSWSSRRYSSSSSSSAISSALPVS